MKGRQHRRLGQEQLSYGMDSIPRFGEGERWQHRWDTQDWTRQRGKLSTKQLESELGSDQHRSSVEMELLKLTSQDKRRAEHEDIEFKMMSPLTQSDTLPGKAAYNRRRISGFQSVMPTRLLFNDTVEWDNRTAQLEGRRHMLLPPKMSTVDTSDGWEERDGHHCRQLSKERPQIVEIYSSQILHRRHQPVLGLSPGTTEVDTKTLKERTATRTTTGRQPMADHWRNGTRPTPGGGGELE